VDFQKKNLAGLSSGRPWQAISRWIEVPSKIVHVYKLGSSTSDVEVSYIIRYQVRAYLWNILMQLWNEKSWGEWQGRSLDRIENWPYGLNDEKWLLEIIFRFFVHSFCLDTPKKLKLKFGKFNSSKSSLQTLLMIISCFLSFCVLLLGGGQFWRQTLPRSLRRWGSLQLG
jgi:hypothetical protein